MFSYWKCRVTGEKIDISDCLDCHTQSCLINAGFADDPIRVDVSWKCFVTESNIDPDECYDCRTLSCPVNTGWASGPQKIVVEGD